MSTRSQRLLPPKNLASLIAGAVFRDTRGAVLNDAQRLNYFPATPLVTVTRIFHGHLHRGQDVCGMEDLKATHPLPQISLLLASDIPTVSWSPGEVAALTLAFYPDAWARLTGKPDCRTIPPAISAALAQIDPLTAIDSGFQHMCRELGPYWQSMREKNPFIAWIGSDKIVDWTRHIVSQSAFSQRGRSPRTGERMLRQMTGQSRRSLEFYAKLENLHRERQMASDIDLADTALAADFSDQSHMGRALKRATGFSPAALNRRIESDESFWCYRLLGERF